MTNELVKLSLLPSLLVCVFSGCSCDSVNRFESEALAAVKNTLFVKDAATGEEIRDFLLVTMHLEYEYEGPTPMIIAPELQKQPRVLKVELRKMSSSSELNQPRLTDQYEQGPQITTITSDRLDYTILKKGYRYGTLTCDMVAGFKETGKPMLITIERLQPGQMKSDVSALSCAQSFLQADLAAIGRGDPLRGELVAVLRENLEQVKNAGQYEKWDPRHEVDATLRALRAEQ